MPAKAIKPTGRPRNTDPSQMHESMSLFSIDPGGDATVAPEKRSGGLTDALFNVVAPAVGIDTLAGMMDHSIHETSAPQSTLPKLKISAKQLLAIQKYPSLLEVLGGDDGDRIVKDILTTINKIMINKIGANSKKLSKYATACETSRQNIKQYFVGQNEEWACCVTASGPFRGDESIYYDPTKDESRILRVREEGYDDVTTSFNVIHESARK